jgi:hypothetical protein
MPLTQWRNRRERAKQKLKVLQMLMHSGVIRPAEFELRYSIPLVKGAATVSFEDRIPYGLYLSGRASRRKTSKSYGSRRTGWCTTSTSRQTLLCSLVPLIEAKVRFFLSSVTPHSDDTYPPVLLA